MTNTQTTKPNRKHDILQALANMLETSAGQKITTAKLAENVGVSEAALYRHFPSKSKMFEGLIELIEESILSRINMIQKEEKDTFLRCHHILQLILLFAERNPGIARVMTTEPLIGEKELTSRINRLYEKIELQFKQILREKTLREGVAFVANETVLARLLLAYAEGCILKFVRTDFKYKPSADFKEQWLFIEKQLKLS